MPRLRKENRVARRIAALERKKKPKMPSRWNEKPLMLVTLWSRVSWMQKSRQIPCTEPPDRLLYRSYGGPNLGVGRQGVATTRTSGCCETSGGVRRGQRIGRWLVGMTKIPLISVPHGRQRTLRKDAF